jgi:uncharacterized membrane protein
MKRSLIIASWCTILFGLIHEATFLYTHFGATEPGIAVQAMKNQPVAGTSTNLYSFYTGYALMMGLLLVALGLIGLLLARAGAERLFLSSGLGAVHMIVYLSALLLSTLYFSFVVPIALTGLAFAFTVYAWVRGRHAST